VDLFAYRIGTLLASAETTSGAETVAFDTVPGDLYVVVLTGWGGITSSVPASGAYTATVTFATP
jgi:hypothetical protein